MLLSALMCWCCDRATAAAIAVLVLVLLCLSAIPVGGERTRGSCTTSTARLLDASNAVAVDAKEKTTFCMQ